MVHLNQLYLGTEAYDISQIKPDHLWNGAWHARRARACTLIQEYYAKPTGLI